MGMAWGLIKVMTEEQVISALPFVAVISRPNQLFSYISEAWKDEIVIGLHKGAPASRWRSLGTILETGYHLRLATV